MEQPTTTSVIPYRPRLDGLRFVAISAVLVEHFGGLLSKYVLAGYYGVDFFFVISGYLITGILVKDRNSSFSTAYKRFMGRRVLRIFPLYFLVVGILLAIDFSVARDFWFWLVTYTLNYGAVFAGDADRISYLWSLSVEEQFYLLWPLVVLLLRRRPALLLAVTALLVVVSYAQITFHIFPSLVPFDYMGLFNRMGSLGLGAAGAIYASNWQLPARVFRSVVVECLVMACLILTLVHQVPFRFVLMGCCSLFFVLKAGHFDFRIPLVDRLLMNRRIIYIGTISYGIYLFHVPIGDLAGRYLFDGFWLSIPFESLGPFEVLRWNSWILKLPLYSAMSITVAAVSFRWFEVPILALKEKWFGYASLQTHPKSPGVPTQPETARAAQIAKLPGI